MLRDLTINHRTAGESRPWLPAAYCTKKVNLSTAEPLLNFKVYVALRKKWYPTLADCPKKNVPLLQWRYISHIYIYTYICTYRERESEGEKLCQSGKFPILATKVNACVWRPILSQNIEISNNKHVYLQSQVRKPTGSGVEWAECSLIMGMV